MVKSEYQIWRHSGSQGRAGPAGDREHEQQACLPSAEPSYSMTRGAAETGSDDLRNYDSESPRKLN